VLSRARRLFFGWIERVSERVFDWGFDRRGDESVEEWLTGGGWPRWASVPKVQARLRLHLLRRLRSDGDKMNSLLLAGQCIDLLRSHHLDHASVDRCLTAAAEVYEWCEDWEAALPLREEDLVIEEGHHGPDDPRTLVAMEWVATDSRRVGDLDKATSLLRHTHGRWVAAEGEAGRHAIHTEIQLGITLQMAGTYDEAQTSLEHAISLLSDDNPMASNAYAHLASARSRQGDHEAAVELQKKSLELQIAKNGMEDRETLTKLRNLAMFHWRAHDIAAAERLLLELVAAHERISGSDAPETEAAQAMLDQLRSEE
jgi:tetratricopeptide (TPR) repeat protein